MIFTYNKRINVSPYFYPTCWGEFAESPAVLEGYLKLDEIIGKTDFTPKEQ